MTYRVLGTRYALTHARPSDYAGFVGNSRPGPCVSELPIPGACYCDAVSVGPTCASPRSSVCLGPASVDCSAVREVPLWRRGPNEALVGLGRLALSQVYTPTSAVVDLTPTEATRLRKVSLTPLSSWLWEGCSSPRVDVTCAACSGTGSVGASCTSLACGAGRLSRAPTAVAAAAARASTPAVTVTAVTLVTPHVNVRMRAIQPCRAPFRTRDATVGAPSPARALSFAVVRAMGAGLCVPSPVLGALLRVPDVGQSTRGWLRLLGHRVPPGVSCVRAAAALGAGCPWPWPWSWRHGRS